MNRFIWMISCLAMIVPGSLFSQIRDTRSDTWIGVDELQRVLPDSSITGGPRTGKTVGLFYYLWHLEDANASIKDISKILRGEDDWGPAPSFHHWGESLYGYYSMKDEYVIRKHIQMISDAGVDFLFVDNTNALIYTDYALKLLSVLKQMKSEGYRVPQVSFILYNGDMNGAIEGLDAQIFSQSSYEDLFFKWEGKPLILGHYTGTDTAIHNGYTFRLGWAWTSQPWFTETGGEERWPWLDNYPQNPGLKNGIPEQITVAAAQHPIGEYAIGKSTGADRMEEPAYGSDGKYFSLQWDRALDVDPPILMITQWNEWIAQRFIYQDEQWHQPVTHMVRKPLKKGQSIFIDVYSAEYSRDLEPLRTEYRDNMYMQMAGNIRRYKGSRKREPASNPGTINLDAGFAQWENIGPVFLDDLWDVVHRDHVSYGADLVYTNTSGRNDLDSMKVSYDGEYLYFFATARETLSPYTDTNWMLLLINADMDYTTGWHGYDFILNDAVLTADTTTLKHHRGPGFIWDDPKPVDMRISGRRLHARIKASELGINTSRPFGLDFKWVDNSMPSDDIMDLYVDGDAAPNHRFNYRYQAGMINPPPVQSHFPEYAIVLPGRLEAEFFDRGGEGIAYHDNDTVNRGAAFRNAEGVDIRMTPDTVGVYDIGWLAGGEWLEYIIYVREEGIYDIHTRASSLSDSNRFHIELNGFDITGSQQVKATPSLDSFTGHDTSAFIKAGHYILKLVVDRASDDFHINYMDFSRRLTDHELRELECGPRMLWDWEENDECWTLANHLQGNVSAGIFTLQVTGEDPYMHSSENINIASRAYNAVQIRMRNLSSDTCAQLYWVTGTQPIYSEARSQPFSIRAYDPDFTDYRIHLGKHTEWKGLVTQLRLDPVCRASSGQVELDRMEVYYDPSADIPDRNRDGGALHVWPNPASANLQILLDGAGPVRIRLTDSAGRILLTKNYDKVKGPVEINTSFLDSGIYHLHVTREGGTHVSPVIIQH